MLRSFIQLGLAFLLSFTLLACSTAEVPEQEKAAQPASPPTAAESTEMAAPEVEIAAPTSIPTEEDSAVAPTAEVVAEEPAAEPTAAPAEQVEAQSRLYQIVPAASQASYAVEEEFFNQPVDLFTAVGVTNAIDGEFQLDIQGNQVSLLDNKFTVDLRTLASDNSRRDGRIRNEWLESNKFPFAEFTATAIENFPEQVSPGQDISFKLTGDMTIRDVTRPVTFDTTARLDGNRFTGVATTHLFMRDFGFEPPSILGMLQVTDGVTVTVNFTAEEVKKSS
jgi:polyisoprenoid-binding protein YceI